MGSQDETLAFLSLAIFWATVQTIGGQLTGSRFERLMGKYYTILCYTILYYTIPYYTILYYTTLCFTMLYVKLLWDWKIRDQS